MLGKPRPQLRHLVGGGKSPYLPVPGLAQDLSEEPRLFRRRRRVQTPAQVPYRHRRIPEKVGNRFRVVEIRRQGGSDGRTVYFNRASEDRSELSILTAERLEDGSWTAGRTVSFSSAYLDVDPFVTEDGSRLFFSSNRPTASESEAGDFDLWVVDRTADGSWSEPRNLGSVINTDATEIYSTLSRNGTLYFSSDREGESFIYRSRYVEGRYEEPERLVLGTEKESAGGNPAIAPDESFLVFNATRENGLGGGDLYVSSGRDGAWTSPRLLAEPISSAYADFAPHLTWDGGLLFWTSERPGVVAEGAVTGRPPGDLYSMPWSAP